MIEKRMVAKELATKKKHGKINEFLGAERTAWSTLLSRPGSASAPYEPVVRTDDHTAVPVAEPPSSPRSPLLEQPEIRVLALEQGEEREIKSIVGNRRAGKHYEYQVR